MNNVLDAAAVALTVTLVAFSALTVSHLRDLRRKNREAQRHE